MFAPEYFLIAEDHSLVNRGYKSLLTEHFPNSRLKFVSSIRELEETLSQQGQEFTFALWDLELEGGDTAPLVASTLKKFPALYILVVTNGQEELFADWLYKAGVRGFMHKTSREDELLLAIRTILADNMYYSKSYRKHAGAGAPPSDPESNPFSSLSVREMEILKQLLAGKRLKDIADQMELTPSTVATYKQRMLKKLNLDNLVDVQKLGLGRGHPLL
ncbi:MAG: response regulator transcription factor [Candidatus Pseudobacter hemicellulosilyticus]|uniref:Response regulator transcription factor n=1 Tax=Candidatus Pseudobacter hemicellulosilyticus TaxID=3121375 RepID=A0AAJ5WTG5_9BACT|nr:MAG: response regulator transcription factor [Pseudobacter sp.]